MENTLVSIIENNDNIVFFGGAGVSTESGIPDFRSESGLYYAKEKYGYGPEEILSRDFFFSRTEEFYKYYRENMLHLNAMPNPAHIALATLEARGKIRGIVTQNIDGLHQKAGSINVYELHGSVMKNSCLDCNAKYPVEYLVKSKDTIPKCEKCGGTIKPEVILYQESLIEEVIQGAVEAISSADVMIVGGTSLVVYPAAGLIKCFKGSKLILINRTPTEFDHLANLVINENIGQAFSVFNR